MKRLTKTLCASLCLTLALAGLAGCDDTADQKTISSGNVNAAGYIAVANSPDEVRGDESKGALAAVTGFTFDFETLDYSFTGDVNAEFYYIRVFPVTDGVEGNSASFQSDKIDASSANTYSGTIEGQVLLAGDYVAHVVASAAGYTSSDAQLGGSSTMQGNPTLSATWNTGGGGGFPGMPGGDPGGNSDEPVAVTADISITAAKENVTKSYTLVVTNEAGTEVYRNENAAAGSTKLTAADLGVEELATTDVYNVTVTVNQEAGYKVPAEGVTAQIAERRFGPPM